MLLAAAVVLVAVAEWPRLRAVLGIEARERRDRERRKQKLRVIQGQASFGFPSDPDSDEFAASVQRDLDRLPVTTDDLDDRRKRR